MDELDFRGSIASWEISRNYVKYMLSKYEGKSVVIKLSSFGGDINEALAIQKVIADHGNVEVSMYGFNASCATWMIFSAQKIAINADAFWLCHKSTTPVAEWAMLNSDQLQALIDKLESEKKGAEAIDAMIVKKYLDRCSAKGKTAEDVLNLMKEERWMSASEALEWGFVDEVVTSKSKTKITNEIKTRFNEMGYPALPEDPSPGIVGKVIDSIVTTFSKKQNDFQIPKIENMEKKFTILNELLVIDGFVVENGVTSITEAQLQRVTDRLNELIAQNKTLSTDLEVAKAAQANGTELEKFNSISDEFKALSTDEKVSKIKELLNSVPAPGSAGHQGNKQDPETQRYNEVATDPVNKMFRK